MVLFKMMVLKMAVFGLAVFKWQLSGGSTEHCGVLMTHIVLIMTEFKMVVVKTRDEGRKNWLEP